MEKSFVEKYGFWIAMLICGVTFFVNNQVFIPDIMESRNLVTAREMVYDGNWMIPTMNGDLRLEKPPLPTWITALAEIISPDSVPLARGMAGVAGCMLVGFLYGFAKKILKISPLIPVLLFCTCYNAVLMGRTASWDIYTHAFMLGGIYFFACALRSPGRSVGQFLLSGLFIGLSIMSKGPVSLFALFLPYLLAEIFVFHPSFRNKWLGIALLIPTALAVGCWWYAYVYIFHSDALQAVALKESGSWINRNVRPWFYYWKFFLETGVWSLLLLTSVFLPLFSYSRRGNRGWLFSVLWMLMILVLLSCLPEKKPRYVLPVLIPASYVMAYMIAWWREEFARRRSWRRTDKLVFRINDLLIAVVILAIPVLAWEFVFGDNMSLALYISLCIVCAIIGAWLVVSAVRLRPMGMLWGVTLFFLIAEALFLPSVRNLINNPEMKSISLTRTDPRTKDIPFYFNDKDPLRIEVVYAAGKKIRPLKPVTDSVMARLPMVILTHGYVSQELPEAVLQRVDTVFIGSFDDNRRPVSSGRFNPDFLYNVTLLKAKK